jgi:hypothetical protein
MMKQMQRRLGFWKRIASKPVAERSDTEVVVAKLLVSQWASKDGQASSEAVLKLAATDPIKNEVMPIALESWANSSPAKAAEWYLSPDRANLRKMPQPKLARFTRSAFKGLYAVNAAQAVQSLDKLGETGELLGAINGIVIASATKGEDAATLDIKFDGLTSDFAKAQFHIFKAARVAEKSIKDPKQRNEFLKYNQDVLPE